MSRDKQQEDIKSLVLRVLHEKEDWSKHLAHSCNKCEKCTCGKHKCKFTPLKLNLKPTNTTYHQSYRKHEDLDHCKDLVKAPVNGYHPNQLVQKSQYREEYVRKGSKKMSSNQLGHAKPNNLSTGGPTFNTTIYKQDYPPKCGQVRKKIKNPENLANSNMRMNTESNYQDKYKWNNRKQPKCQQPIKRENNLKVGSDPFTSSSSYNHDFNVIVKSKYRDKDNFAPDRTYTSTPGVRPKSSYQSDYTQKKNGYICPATYMP